MKTQLRTSHLFWATLLVAVSVFIGRRFAFYTAWVGHIILLTIAGSVWIG